MATRNRAICFERAVCHENGKIRLCEKITHQDSELMCVGSDYKSEVLYVKFEWRRKVTDSSCVPFLVIESVALQSNYYYYFINPVKQKLRAI